MSYEREIVGFGDIGNLQLPRTCTLSIRDIVRKIKSMPLGMVDTCSMAIRAYGNDMNISQDDIDELEEAGVKFINVEGTPQEVTNRLLMDIYRWVSENPPPAYVFLLSGDRDFIYCFQGLVQRGYTPLLIESSGSSSRELINLAEQAWEWEEVCMKP